jgi:hypothetical protein
MDINNNNNASNSKIIIAIYKIEIN